VGRQLLASPCHHPVSGVSFVLDGENIMSEQKKHYFEVVMNSYSDGVLNQEVIVREYAKTGEELTVKNMKMARDVIPAVVKSFDEMSQPVQEAGMQQMMAEFEAAKGKK
jgi:hypothetical protein